MRVKEGRYKKMREMIKGDMRDESERREERDETRTKSSDPQSQSRTLGLSDSVPDYPSVFHCYSGYLPGKLSWCDAAA